MRIDRLSEIRIILLIRQRFRKDRLLLVREPASGSTRPPHRPIPSSSCTIHITILHTHTHTHIHPHAHAHSIAKIPSCARTVVIVVVIHIRKPEAGVHHHRIHHGVHHGIHDGHLHAHAEVGHHGHGVEVGRELVLHAGEHVHEGGGVGHHLCLREGCLLRGLLLLHCFGSFRDLGVLEELVGGALLGGGTWDGDFEVGC